ncbi:hypothetical protein JCM3770_004050 [Rhodotorula araucariae]
MRLELLLSSLAAAAALASAQHQDQPHRYNHQRRWVWGSVINDVPEGQPTPAGVPPIGLNVDQLRCITHCGNPGQPPYFPSFPPAHSEVDASTAPDAKAAVAEPASLASASLKPLGRIPFWQLQTAVAAMQPSPATPTTTLAAASSAVAVAAAAIAVLRPTNRQEVAAYLASVNAANSAAAAAAARVDKRNFRGGPPTAILQDPMPRAHADEGASQTLTPGMGGTWTTTPDAGGQLARPTFSGPSGVMPSGGVEGSEAMSRPTSALPSAASPATGLSAPGTVAPAQNPTDATIHTALQLNELNQAVVQLLGGLRGLLGLHKREEVAVQETDGRTRERSEPRANQLGKDCIRRVRRHGDVIRPIGHKRRVVDRE